MFAVALSPNLGLAMAVQQLKYSKSALLTLDRDRICAHTAALIIVCVQRAAEQSERQMTACRRDDICRIGSRWPAPAQLPSNSNRSKDFSLVRATATAATTSASLLPRRRLPVPVKFKSLPSNDCFALEFY